MMHFEKHELSLRTDHPMSLTLAVSVKTSEQMTMQARISATVSRGYQSRRTHGILKPSNVALAATSR